MKMKFIILIITAAVLFLSVESKKPTCEICVGFIAGVLKELESRGIERSQSDEVEKVVLEVCKKATTKEAKLCNFIGASATSATSIVRKSVVDPIGRSLPAEKVCEYMNKADGQICELTKEAEIDWKTIDLNKLRVKELKNILARWGEQCHACTEKTEFVKRIQELKPKYVKEEL